MGVLGYLMGVLGYLMGVLGYPRAWRRRQAMAKWRWGEESGAGPPFRAAARPWDIRERPLDIRERPLDNRGRSLDFRKRQGGVGTTILVIWLD